MDWILALKEGKATNVTCMPEKMEVGYTEIGNPRKRAGLEAKLMSSVLVMLSLGAFEILKPTC